tara:strand:- start:1473 stop:1892 length:420 start_codon:yes stop_codon:yes gene_type:complete
VPVESKMPFEMNDEERKLFSIAVETDDHSGTEVQVADDIFQGRLKMWVWRSDDSVVLIIGEFTEHRDGFREFFISMLAGSDVMDMQLLVVEDLRKELLSLGCQYLSAFLKPGLAEKFGTSSSGSFLSDKIRYIVIGTEV